MGGHESARRTQLQWNGCDPTAFERYSAAELASVSCHVSSPCILQFMGFLMINGTLGRHGELGRYRHEYPVWWVGSGRACSLISLGDTKPVGEHAAHARNPFSCKPEQLSD